MGLEDCRLYFWTGRCSSEPCRTQGACHLNFYVLNKLTVTLFPQSLELEVVSPLCVFLSKPTLLEDLEGNTTLRIWLFLGLGHISLTSSIFLYTLSTWMSDRHFKFNMLKTELLLHVPTQPQPTITLLLFPTLEKWYHYSSSCSVQKLRN